MANKPESKNLSMCEKSMSIMVNILTFSSISISQRALGINHTVASGHKKSMPNSERADTSSMNITPGGLKLHEPRTKVKAYYVMEPGETGRIVENKVDVNPMTSKDRVSVNRRPSPEKADVNERATDFIHKVTQRLKQDRGTLNEPPIANPPLR
ncbi:hypothetical protein AMTRI_Chr02g213910 [Amborella trichopoda]|uniref:Uncharacterized protein n=1 Tax=Amborella trichopoda TaxID=13333 RepID=U5CPB1_AMBTC|nr:hypothetical protein AMTR_s00032p00228750 [Amborella trichopoda]